MVYDPNVQDSYDTDLHSDKQRFPWIVYTRDVYQQPGNIVGRFATREAAEKHLRLVYDDYQERLFFRNEIESNGIETSLLDD